MAGEHVERLRLRFSPDDLFALVSDVRRYPEFLEPITALRVSEDHVRDGQGSLKAEARIRFKFVRERFATKVTVDRSTGTIDVDYLSGPFHTLANRWVFHPLEDGSTLVDFWIRYGFRNPVLQMLMNENRARAILYLIDAFRREAETRYELVGTHDFDVTHALRTLPPTRR